MKHNTTSSIRNLLSKSLSSKHKTNLKTPKSNNKNDPPLHPNIKQLLPIRTPSKSLSFKAQIAASDDGHPEVSKSQDPPLKSQSEFPKSDDHYEVSLVSDPPVKVVVRVRLVYDHENERDVNQTVRKVSSDSLSIRDRKFTFDSVFDSNSNQVNIDSVTWMTKSVHPIMIKKRKGAKQSST